VADRLVDGRELEPPEPMHRVLEEVEGLPPGDAVVLLLPREPFPLYRVLQTQGLTWATTLEPDGTFVIRITHP
jgi:uncharacterized protein (DUF2249 family)